MKKTHIFVLATTVFISFHAKAERLLRCNPPMESSLQEVEIKRENGIIKLNELNMNGWRSDPKVINNKAWAAKNIRWQSKDEGSVRLYLAKEHGQEVWIYLANHLEVKVRGYCERTN